MTDGQWALLAPLLPAARSTGGRGGRPEKWDRRLVLDAIFYLVRGGIAWRAR
jgi:transposase